MGTILATFEKAFVSLDARSRALLEKIDDSWLHQKPRQIPGFMGMFSCGEYLLRSAAMVEKTFGGITTRLWDDPYEWTLPEKLSTRAAILEYMDEVDATMRRGFSLFTSDDELARQIPSPEKIRPISEVLLETLAHAEHYQGRAFAVFQMLSDEKLPRI